MNRTGRATGTLEPVIYFQRSDGMKILPTYDAGHPELARKVFEERYRNHPTEKWMWCVTNGTLSSVDALQKDLEDQERRNDKQMLAAHGFMRDAVRSRVADNLRQRMCSAATSEYEREFIAAYLKLREDPKRDKYRQALEHRNYYLYARELNASTRVEDVAMVYPGEFWRSPEQQK